MDKIVVLQINSVYKIASTGRTSYELCQELEKTGEFSVFTACKNVEADPGHMDVVRKLVYVKGVRGKMEISWPGDYGEIHTRILQRMRQVLCEDTVYPYLKPQAAQRLRLARKVFRNAGAHRRSLIPMGGMTFCMFPWLGTRSFRTLRKYLKKNAARLGISQIEYEGCCYMTMKMDDADDTALLSSLYRMVKEEGIDRLSLVEGAEMPVFEKFDPYIPGKLLRRAYVEDRLRTDEIEARLPQMLDECRFFRSAKQGD